MKAQSSHLPLCPDGPSSFPSVVRGEKFCTLAEAVILHATCLFPPEFLFPMRGFPLFLGRGTEQHGGGVLMERLFFFFFGLDKTWMGWRWIDGWLWLGNGLAW